MSYKGVHNKTAEKIRRMIAEEYSDSEIVKETGQPFDIVRRMRDGMPVAEEPSETSAVSSPQKKRSDRVVSSAGPSLSDSESELVKRFIDQTCFWWLEKRGFKVKNE